jgi:biopolymer transport protein TolR
MSMKRRTRRPKILSEINITPFTDVVLVLLIIFMIATPFIYQASTKVELPQGSKADENPQEVVITINAQGDVFMDDEKMDLGSLKFSLLQKVKQKPDVVVIINGDKNVRYNSVMQVIDILTQAGIKSPCLGIELKR